MCCAHMLLDIYTRSAGSVCLYLVVANLADNKGKKALANQDGWTPWSAVFCHRQVCLVLKKKNILCCCVIKTACTN